MARSTRTDRVKDQLRPSKAAQRMRESLGLSAADWQSFLWHARNGFADFERWHDGPHDTALSLKEVPAQWLEDPEAIGWVALRVIREGNARLAAPLARYFLDRYRPGRSPEPLPPALGIAWLALARAGMDPPIEPARLAEMALYAPRSFLLGIDEPDLLELSRCLLEARGAIEAHDLHALFAAVDRAQIQVRAPYRLFESLIKQDWLPERVKRDFCRGLLGCEREMARLREWREGLRASFVADPEKLCLIPGCWADVMDSGVGSRLPGLRRHAVCALVEDLGEPLDVVVREFLLRPYPDQESESAVSMGVLDLIARHAKALGEKRVKSHLAKAIKHGLAHVRQAAYRVGAECFGLAYARPALKDPAGLVRNWAAKTLETKTLHAARGYRSKERSAARTDA
jgi:hypothetical protein